jgi:hypothetical protein
VTSSSRSDRLKVADTLRSWREQSGMSGNAFSHKVGWVQSKVSKIETAKQLPTEADVRIWGRETGADSNEVDSLVEALGRARIQYETFRSQYGTAGGAAANQTTVAARERAMIRKSSFHVSMIPGLLQTARYAQEMLMRPSGPPMHGATDDDVMRMVAIRMQRQQYVLYGPDNKYFDVVLLEGALRTRVCSIDTMIEQLDRLIGLNGLPRITFGVIPFGVEVPTIPLTGFDIFDGDDVFIETVTSELRVNRVEEVQNYLELFQMLQKSAMYGSEAIRLLRDAMTFYGEVKNNA